MYDASGEDVSASCDVEQKSYQNERVERAGLFYDSDKKVIIFEFSKYEKYALDIEFDKFTRKIEIVLMLCVRKRRVRSRSRERCCLSTQCPPTCL